MKLLLDHRNKYIYIIYLYILLHNIYINICNINILEDHLSTKWVWPIDELTRWTNPAVKSNLQKCSFLTLDLTSFLVIESKNNFLITEWDFIWPSAKFYLAVSRRSAKWGPNLRGPLKPLGITSPLCSSLNLPSWCREALTSRAVDTYKSWLEPMVCNESKIMHSN